MLISVIIPTFNRISTLPRALESVFSQDFFESKVKFEVIVVDDGSTDATSDYINHRWLEDNPNTGSALTLIQQSNAGVSAARNAGLNRAKGEWVALLDSDDQWLPHKLSRQFDLISQTDLKVCHTEEIWIRNGVRVNQMNKHKKSGGDVFQQSLGMCAMSPSSILLHKSVFDLVGVFDESLPACEDYDLWLKISAHYQVAFVQEACIKKYGGHSDQLSRAFWGMDRFRVLALENVLKPLNSGVHISAKQQKSVLAMLKKKNQILLNGAKKHQNNSLQADCEARIERLGL